MVAVVGYLVAATASIACIWFLASVENVKPMARLVAMKNMSASERSRRLPTIGTSKR